MNASTAPVSPIKLVPTPDKFQSTVVVGTSLRKTLAVLQPFFASLAWQEWPTRVTPLYCFVDDGLEPDAREFVTAWLQERGGTLLRGGPSAVRDFNDTNADSHEWSPSAMHRVGANKDKIFAFTLQQRADAVWLADSDLIMDPTTIHSLWHADKPIAAAVYYTRWTKRGHETREIHAAPQVWLRHPYQLDGRGMDEFEFRRKLMSRALTRVWGQGACSLIRRPVLEAGIDFSPLPDPQLQQGLMAGEDRQFCIKAERAHIEMYGDSWPDIYHIYHLPDDCTRIPEMVQRLGSPHPTRASLGDLVSLKVQAVEPMPMPNNQWAQVPTQHLRGRLGQLALLPELEEAVWNLERGHEHVVPVHVPYDYPIPYLRGRRRLIRVQLVDVKPFGFSPVIEDELFVGPLSKRFQDSCALSEKQHGGMKEVALA